jgi:hypothetical protein
MFYAMEILNVRRLVALDIALHGSKFIIFEFSFGVIFGFVLGLYLLKSNHLLGWYIITLGLNYIPLLIYAINITRIGSAKNESKDDLSNRKRLISFSIRQFVIFVPFSTILLSIFQELRK